MENKKEKLNRNKRLAGTARLVIDVLDGVLECCIPYYTYVYIYIHLRVVIFPLIYFVMKKRIRVLCRCCYWGGDSLLRSSFLCEREELKITTAAAPKQRKFSSACSADEERRPAKSSSGLRHFIGRLVL